MSMNWNLFKEYNSLLDISAMDPIQRERSLKGIFERDISENKSFTFLGKQITPTPQDGKIEMETLYRHLTTVIVDRSTNQRDFEIHRSKRLHWVRYHVEQKKKADVLFFTVKEPEGYRTYIYDIVEKYVIVLEPKKNNTTYFLLTAYYVQGKDAQRDKIMKKYKRKLDTVL